MHGVDDKGVQRRSMIAESTKVREGAPSSWPRVHVRAASRVFVHVLRCAHDICHRKPHNGPSHRSSSMADVPYLRQCEIRGRAAGKVRVPIQPTQSRSSLSCLRVHSNASVHLPSSFQPTATALRDHARCYRSVAPGRLRFSSSFMFSGWMGCLSKFSCVTRSQSRGKDPWNDS